MMVRLAQGRPVKCGFYSIILNAKLTFYRVSQAIYSEIKIEKAQTDERNRNPE